MSGGMLGDPKVRRAYIVTKAGVFAAAAVATWPLSRVFGVKAWYGLGVFGAILAVLTLVVLAVGRASLDAADSAENAAETGDEDDESSDEPVVVPVEDSLDLHSFPPRDIPSVVAEYLEAAHERGLREVRLIHGRGIGVQRERVRSLLSKHPLVHSYHDAPPQGGGWGATVAYLKSEG